MKMPESPRQYEVYELNDLVHLYIISCSVTATVKSFQIVLLYMYVNIIIIMRGQPTFNKHLVMNTFFEAFQYGHNQPLLQQPFYTGLHTHFHTGLRSDFHILQAFIAISYRSSQAFSYRPSQPLSYSHQSIAFVFRSSTCINYIVACSVQVELSFVFFFFQWGIQISH